MSFALLFHYRKEIITAFLVILFYILWFTIERQSDRIVSQKAEIKALTAEVENLHAEYARIEGDVTAVSAYLTKIRNIETTNKIEVKKNEECVAAHDPDTFIDRLNELFGYCSDEAGNQAKALPRSR